MAGIREPLIGFRFRRLICLAFICSYLPMGIVNQVAGIDPPTPSAVLQELRSFRELGSVLHVAAHPDDENTQLITYFARGRGYRTAYLSITRGDGGQNVLGGEFGSSLGVIRTQELLAARRLDGGRQFFTRALDFGFSKDYQETLRIWDKKEVLGDVVRVIRTFRPDVVITKFTTQASNTHGHHTSSSILAVEAFALAGDPKAYPEQLKDLKAWQPKRLFLNNGGGGSATPIRIDIGGIDPVSGDSFSDIAKRSRAMHKSQGFDNFAGKGGGVGGARIESFQLVRGDPASKDLFDGIDTTWNRVPGGAEIAKLTDEAIAKFNSQDLSANVPALLAIHSRLIPLGPDTIVDEKFAQLGHVIQSCLGLSVETTVDHAELVAGESFDIKHKVVVGSKVPVRWVATSCTATGDQSERQPVDLHRAEAATLTETRVLPKDTPLSQPYWLREPGTIGMFRVDDASLIGRPENRPIFLVAYTFEVGGQKLILYDEPVQVTQDAKKREVRRRLEVIAPVALHFTSDVALFAPGSSRTVEVEATAFRKNSAGVVKLEGAEGWQVRPASQPFNLQSVGDKAKFVFTVTAPSSSQAAQLGASIMVDGVRYANQHVDIKYDHLPPLLLQPVAKLKAVSLELAIRGKRVGYVPGAGDQIAESLEEMGYEVLRLSGKDLVPEKLKGLDAVVIGIRAFNVRTDLVPRLPDLCAFAESGGNVIVQYNTPKDLKTTKFAPYDLKISQDRVTDETATMTFLAPDHPALNTPNKITSADFDGWVQERGLYFPSEWDRHFVPLLACNDPGAAVTRGSLLVAPYGKGHFVYTGLAWFRQLPEGVPGAYRLFANLVSLGK